MLARSTRLRFPQWLFGISNNPAWLSAELATNSYGVPVANLTLGQFSSEFIEEDLDFLGCRQGIWDMGRAGT